ncbi:uncharacterized protein LOC125547178 [Triticum urartu]|uniref:uncharacterized protein LOC125547178 n=1 Tax=Triticum urartu TaxID=4572 RepID=UPI0020438267|nr:uncharacterized protein LOC125547178 [Triticum urartu]
MAGAAATAATTLLPGLPDEIVVWEILVRLDPRSILRSRAVRRDWRCATTNCRFLLAHHARQPALPIFSSDSHRNILTFDHRAAAASQLHTIAQLTLSQPFKLEASCDGLIIISKHEMAGPRPGLSSRTLLSVCNPVTRQHVSLTQPLWDFNILGMYQHRPTGGYRLLLQGTSFMVFDTMAESFRQIRAPLVPTNSSIFEMDDMLGIYSCNKAKKIVDIWVLQNYESEVWDLKYRVDLPTAEIWGKFEGIDADSYWYVTVVSGDGVVLLLVSFAGNKKRQILLLPDLQVAPDFWKTLEHYWAGVVQYCRYNLSRVSYEWIGSFLAAGSEKRKIFLLPDLQLAFDF